MNNKLVIVVLAVVLLFSVAFSALLIVSLKESAQTGDVNVGETDTGSETDSETESSQVTDTESETEKADDPHKNDGLTKAPDITVYDLSGNPVKLSDYLGKPVVLSFWATWCGQCMDEMPEFDEVYKQYNGEVVFLMVNRTDGMRETAEMAVNYVMSKRFELPMFLDTDGEGPRAYGVSALPHTFFINDDGYLVSKVNAKISKTRLLSEIAKIYMP